MSMTESEAIKNVTAYVYMECENMPKQVIQALDIMKDALEKQMKLNEMGDCYIIPKNGVFEVNGVDVNLAIQKQIPKKPIINYINTSEDATEIEYTCSVCGTNFAELTPCKEWCPYCGNKFDWE